MVWFITIITFLRRPCYDRRLELLEIHDQLGLQGTFEHPGALMHGQGTQVGAFPRI